MKDIFTWLDDLSEGEEEIDIKPTRATRKRCGCCKSLRASVDEHTQEIQQCRNNIHLESVAFRATKFPAVTGA